MPFLASLASFSRVLILVAAVVGTIITFLGKSGTPGRSGGLFTTINAIDSDGNLYGFRDSSNTFRRSIDGEVVTQLGGMGGSGWSDGPASTARFGIIGCLALDSSSNVYVGDFVIDGVITPHNYGRIRRITNGVVTTIAGGSPPSAFPATGTNAGFGQPFGMTIDSANNIYFSTSNHIVFKVSPSAVVSILAGSNASAFTNGTGTNARFNTPRGLALDSSSNVYVADTINHAIRRITPAGVVSTFAGTGTSGSNDGAGASATFNRPTDVKVAANGDVFVADSFNLRIRRITPAGVVSTFVGGGPPGWPRDGIGTNVRLGFVERIVLDSAGNLFIGQERKVSSTGVVTTEGELPLDLYNDDVFSILTYSNRISFNTPQHAHVDWNQNLYIADTNNHCIRVRTVSKINTLFAGSTVAGFADGTGVTARFNSPKGIALDTSGNIYVADTSNNRIRSITHGGVVSTIAGTGTAGFLDTAGSSAQFNAPHQLTIDSFGVVYIADTSNHRIRRMIRTSPTASAVSTIAGSGTAGFANGQGANAQFNNPQGVTWDLLSNLYVADTSNHRIRRITAYGFPPDGTNSNTGVVTTLAGSGTAGSNNGIGTNAQFNAPTSLVCDGIDGIFVADTGNHLVRRISMSTGVVTTVEGTGIAGFNTAQFNTPRGISLDRFRRSYIADSSNHSIRSISNLFTLPSNNRVVTTLAGNGTTTFANGTGTNATFNSPTGITVDSAGNITIGDTTNDRVRRITINGVVTTLAGTGTNGFLDGAGTSANFNFLQGVAYDASGNIYVTDTFGQRIRRVLPTGVVSTIAGTGAQGSIDGLGTAATFNFPRGIVVGPLGDIFVADGNNNKIRRITGQTSFFPNGGSITVSTFAGSGAQSSLDGTGTSATFNSVGGIAVDSDGNLYVTELNGNRIRMITSNGVVTTLAGSGTSGFLNGAASSAQFNSPQGVAVDSSRNVYVADSGNNRIRLIRDGVVSTFAGSGLSTFLDGTGTNANFNSPRGIAVDSMGNVYVVDTGIHRIRKIGNAQILRPINHNFVVSYIGNGLTGNTIITSGVGTSSRVNASRGSITDSLGNVFLADTGWHCIRRITLNGTISIVTGGTPSATIGGYVDGASNVTRFDNPSGITIDASSNLYVVDTCNNRIRLITPAAATSTFAGSVFGFSNATGTTARFFLPRGIARNPVNGNFFIADTNNQRIRLMTPGAVVSTYAGTGVIGSGNGAATSATFSGPQGIAVDSNGDVFVGDTSNNLIRRISTSAVVSTFAGTGVAGSNDGAGASATFNGPTALTFDSSGLLYVTDTGSHCIRRITTDGVVSTFAGSTSGFLNGEATTAQFSSPRGITIDTLNRILVSDTGNNRIRIIV